MSKEDLLIALFKSNKSHTELRRSEDNNNTEIEQTKNHYRLHYVVSLAAKFPHHEVR